ncbi:reverse transcriptase domain-containing protein [Tanacetum coccineum]
MIKEERPKGEGEVAVTEEVLVNSSFPDQLVTIRGGLSDAARDQLKCLLKDNLGVFAWEPSDMTGVSRRVIEHALNVNPSLDPVCQKQRTFSTEKSEVVTNECSPIPTSPEPPVAQSRQRRVLCPCRDGATEVLRIQEKVTARQAVYHYDRNLEAYVDDMLIKSRDEKMLLADISETFDNLKKINMKLNPKKCSFGVEEGKFLGYIVTSEGIRANPRKTSALADLQSP